MQLTIVQGQIAYEETIQTNITTLIPTNADAVNGMIQGLLYVPSLNLSPSCASQESSWIPQNVTRLSNLPPSSNLLVAIAPWFSRECALAYLNSARLDRIRAMIFFQANNSTNKPDDVNSQDWNLDDDGEWKEMNNFPVYAVPGLNGYEMLQKLSLYSGNISSIPHGSEIQSMYGPNPGDYVKIWTELSVHNFSGMPALWPYFLIVIGALLLVVALVTLALQYTHRQRRRFLKRRVQSGEVDLEAMGIQRLTVPEGHVKAFPLFTYQTVPQPSDEPVQRPRKSRKKSRRNQEARSRVSETVMEQPSVRSQRANAPGSGDAVATNYQPNCHICLCEFEHRETIIRELPCGHIFHPECIDEFLLENSSLCPMCKHSMLPLGYSPKITNMMVRRERAIRRLREKVDLADYDPEMLLLEESWFRSWTHRLTHPRSLRSSRDNVPLGSVSISDGRRPKLSDESPPKRSSTSESAEQNGISDTANSQQTRQAVHSRPRRTRPRNLNLLPTQVEDDELDIVPDDESRSPTSFARERMRRIAAKNAPIERTGQSDSGCELK